MKKSIKIFAFLLSVIMSVNIITENILLAYAVEGTPALSNEGITYSNEMPDNKTEKIVESEIKNQELEEGHVSDENGNTIEKLENELEFEENIKTEEENLETKEEEIITDENSRSDLNQETSFNKLYQDNDILEEISELSNSKDIEENTKRIAQLKELLGKQNDVQNEQYIPNDRASTSRIQNEWLEYVVALDGKFTIGTIEGNPNYTTDNNKKLLYGHPSPSTSETMILVNNKQYWFKADSLDVDNTNKKITATMQVDKTGIIVKQILSFYKNSSTSRADTIKINYVVINATNQSSSVGIRIMLDTMLASNDDAPFKVSGLGNVTTRRELTGEEITQSYQVYDNLNSPTTMASGYLWLGNERRPDKVQYTNWSTIVDAPWDYHFNEDNYLGDSAIGIYYNPVTISAGGNFSVSTYYGTGLGLSGSSEDNLNIEEKIGENEFVLYVTDAATGNAISDAVVNIDGIESKVTDSLGKAVFTEVAKEHNNVIKSLQITKDGYRNKSASIRITLGSAGSVSIKSDMDTLPMVESVTMTSSNASYNNIDLLHQNVYFNSNPTEIGVTSNNRETVTVTAVTDMNNCVFQLIAAGEVVKENETGIFELDTITNDNNGKTFTTNRICDFEEGNKVYLQVISETGEVSRQSLLGIKVSLPTNFYTYTNQQVELTEKITIEPKSDVFELFFGSEEIGIEFSKLPLAVTYDKDGKVKVAINKEEEKTWDETKNAYETIMGRSDAAKAFGGRPSSFNAGNASINMSVTGYGEGYFENGAIKVDVGVILNVKGDASYTHTFFLGWVPLYIKMGASAEADATFVGNVIINNNLKFTITQGTFEPSLTLSAELGAGASGIISVGVQGKGKLKYLADFLRDYRNVTLNAQASVEVHALLYESSLKIAENTWTLYDSNNNNTTQGKQTEGFESLYNEESFILASRDYMSAQQAVPSDGAVESANSAIYTNAQPVMVKVGGNIYRFWIQDIAERKSVNRTALVYSKYSSANSGWSEPKIVVDDNTSDYNFDLTVYNDEIFIVWQNSKSPYTNNDEMQLNDGTTGLKRMVQDSEIEIAKISTKNDSISSLGMITDNALGDLCPKISVGNDSRLLIVWYQNSKNNVLANGETEEELGITTLQYVNGTISGEDIDIGEITSISLGSYIVTSLDTGNLDGEPSISYVLDTDNKLTTVSDREMYLIHNLGSNLSTKVVVNKETSNVLMDESPRFAKINETDALFWYQDSNFKYTTTTVEQAKSVFKEDDIPTNTNTAYTVLEGSTSTLIVWPATSTTNDANMSIYAAKMDDGIWGLSYELCTLNKIDEPMISSLSGYVDDQGKGNISFAMVKYSDSGVVEYSDLCLAKEEEQYKLYLEDVDYDPNLAAPGKEFDFKVSLRNKGNVNINQVNLMIGDNSVELSGISLQPGERKTIPVTYMLPNYNSVQVYPVSVDLLGHINEATQSDDFNITVGYTDISVEEGERVFIGSSEYTSFIIKNNSQVPAENVNFKILLDEEEDGTVVFDYSFEHTLQPGESSTLICNIENYEGNKVAYKRLTTSTAENLVLNNSGIICIDTQIPDLIETNLFTITVNSHDAGSIEVDENYTNGDNTYTFYKNCDTNETISLNAQPKEGYVFTGWVSSGKGYFSNVHSAQTTFSMPNEDVIVTATFATDNPLTGITLPETYSMNMGDTYRFNPVLAPENTSNYLIWSSENEEIISIDNNGEITAKSVGTARITVTSSADSMIQASCNVTIEKVDLERLRIVFPNVKIAGTDVSQKIRLLKYPLNTTEKVLWSSDNPEIVSVDEEGIIMTHASGTAAITARNEGGTITVSCMVEVSIPLEGIYFQQLILNMLKNEESNIVFLSNPIDSTENISADDIVWQSSNSSVVTLNIAANKKSAKVKAVGTGSAVITVTIGDMTAICNVVVKQLITGITLSPSTLDLEEGQGRTLSVKRTPLDAEGVVIFKSSNTSVATVNSSGYVRGVSAGTAIITAQADTGYSASCAITVVKNEVIVTNINDLQSSHPYSSNTNKTWVYKIDEAKSLVLKFSEESELENNFDKLYIYDKNNNLVKTYTGKTISNATLTVPNHTVKLKLVTDGSVNKYGFKIDSCNPLYDISKADIMIEDQTYSGSELTPVVPVIYKNKTLKLNTDYTVSYSQNINIGTAKFTIMGIGQYSGSKTVDFNIVQSTIKEKNVTVYNQIYTGKAIKAKPVVVINGMVLKEKKDYTLTYANNKKIGKKAKVTITGIGNYKGNVSKSFSIVDKKYGLSNRNTKIKAVKEQTFNGKALKPKLIITFNGKKLSASAYTINYENNITCGKAKVTIHGKGKYAGSISTTFNIVPKKVKITFVQSKVSREVTLRWGEISGATDYQIVYATSKKGKYKELGTTSKIEFTKTGLAKNKTYYLKIRAYTVVKNKKIFGEYSSVKKVKVK